MVDGNKPDGEFIPEIKPLKALNKMIHLTEKQLLFNSILCLLNAIPSLALFVLDLTNSRFSFVSDSMSSIFGINKDHLIGKNAQCFKSYIHPDDHFKILWQFLHTIKNSGAVIPDNQHPAKYEFRIGNTDENSRLVRCTYKVIQIEHDNFVFGSIMNVLRQQLPSCYKEMTNLEHHQQNNIEFSHYIVDKIETDNLQILFQNNNLQRVTKREKEVLSLVACGYSSKQIAGKLNISNYTAINHRKNLISKLSVKNTAELIQKATKNCLV